MYLPRNTKANWRRGTVSVLTCASFTAILFVTAMAIDSGNLMAARRQAQNCCDAAALNAGIQLATLQAQGTTPTTAGLTSAANLSLTNNNYTNGTNCTVTVNWPPAAGNYKNTNSVEVLLTFTYSNLVVNGSNSVTVRSVASSTTSTSPSLPMLVTDPTGANAFLVNGGKLTLASPSIQVNSNNANAAVVTGAAGSTCAATVKAVGGSAGSFSPAAKGGGSPMPDPYALVPVPTTTGLTTYAQSSYNPNSSGNITLNPGYYPNGLYVINGGNVTMNPGLYYVSGGNLWINTTGSVTGNGVTLYHNGPNSSALLNTNYGLNVGISLCLTDNNYTFTPPTTGPYAGISMFQGPNCTAEAFYDFWGTGSLNCGLQYFHNSALRCWSASAGGTINCNELVAKDFKLLGTHEIYGNSYNSGFSKLTWNASRAANRPATNVFLVE